MSTGAPYLEGLVRELVKLPREVEWVEFKQNNDDPQQLGEYISALANASALADKSKGYLLWACATATTVSLGPPSLRKPRRKVTRS
jgi:ATP-dependent DNA helicase RecG